MAERGDSCDDGSSCVQPSEPETRRARIDSLKACREWSTMSPRRSGSHSPLPAWRRAVDLKTPPPPPPSPPPFSVTAWFSSFFKLQKVEPTGVSPVDAKCDKDHVPVIYNRLYDIRGTKKLGLPKQPMILDKSAQVFSAIKGIFIATGVYS